MRLTKSISKRRYQKDQIFLNFLRAQLTFSFLKFLGNILLGSYHFVLAGKDPNEGMKY